MLSFVSWRVIINTVVGSGLSSVAWRIIISTVEGYHHLLRRELPIKNVGFSVPQYQSCSTYNFTVSRFSAKNFIVYCYMINFIEVTVL